MYSSIYVVIFWPNFRKYPSLTAANKYWKAVTFQEIRQKTKEQYPYVSDVWLFFHMHACWLHAGWHLILAAAGMMFCACPMHPRLR
jgi:hypothetical protein